MYSFLLSSLSFFFFFFYSFEPEIYENEQGCNNFLIEICEESPQARIYSDHFGRDKLPEQKSEMELQNLKNFILGIVNFFIFFSIKFFILGVFTP